jgi:hypothetical protein
MRDETDESSLARWLRQAASSAHEPEPADFGTAFGLDMSLLPPDAPPEEAEPDAPPNGWLQRLGLPAR